MAASASGVVLDRVEGQVQAAGALQEADALAGQVVDLLPAFQRGLGALVGLRRGRAGPAGGVRGDFLQGGPGQASP